MPYVILFTDVPVGMTSKDIWSSKVYQGLQSLCLRDLRVRGDPRGRFGSWTGPADSVEREEAESCSCSEEGDQDQDLGQEQEAGDRSGSSSC